MNPLLLALALVAQPGDAKPVLRASVGQFYVHPGVDAALRWEIASGTLADPVEVVVRNLAGKDVTTVRARSLRLERSRRPSIPRGATSRSSSRPRGSVRPARPPRVAAEHLTRSSRSTAGCRGWCRR